MATTGPIYGRDLAEAKVHGYSGHDLTMETTQLLIEMPKGCALSICSDFLYEAIGREWREFQRAENCARLSDAMAAGRNLDFLVQVLDQLEALRINSE